jgi:hypothetical protein
MDNKKDKTVKKYVNPEYMKFSDNELQIKITENFDDIKYILKEEVDLDHLDRKKLEDLYKIVSSLYWLCFDLYCNKNYTKSD